MLILPFFLLFLFAEFCPWWVSFSYVFFIGGCVFSFQYGLFCVYVCKSHVAWATEVPLQGGFYGTFSDNPGVLLGHISFCYFLSGKGGSYVFCLNSKQFHSKSTSAVNPELVFFLALLIYNWHKHYVILTCTYIAECLPQ